LSLALDTRVAIDTNHYRDLCDGLPNVVRSVEEAELVFMPFIVLAELRAGFAMGTRGRDNERVLGTFLTKPGTSVLFATSATTRAYADLYRQLRARGTPIPTNDLWIAALVVENDLTLLTRDQHFRHLPQLRVFDASVAD
jgi:predicted nucleic acid-binding protein